MLGFDYMTKAKTPCVICGSRARVLTLNKDDAYCEACIKDVRQCVECNDFFYLEGTHAAAYDYKCDICSTHPFDQEFYEANRFATVDPTYRWGGPVPSNGKCGPIDDYHEDAEEPVYRGEFEGSVCNIPPSGVKNIKMFTIPEALDILTAQIENVPYVSTIFKDFVPIEDKADAFKAARTAAFLSGVRPLAFMDRMKKIYKTDKSATEICRKSNVEGMRAYERRMQEKDAKKGQYTSTAYKDYLKYEVKFGTKFLGRAHDNVAQQDLVF